mmetsp:Transcript_1340/g.3923  ORF Transcript_1340/g.3923 Transcript_1340/m.3923 type:complete len:459 (-) Transcript_1340:799-2175(-)
MPEGAQKSLKVLASRLERHVAYDHLGELALALGAIGTLDSIAAGRARPADGHRQRVAVQLRAIELGCRLARSSGGGKLDEAIAKRDAVAAVCAHLALAAPLARHRGVSQTVAHLSRALRKMLAKCLVTRLERQVLHVKDTRLGVGIGVCLLRAVRITAGAILSGGSRGLLHGLALSSLIPRSSGALHSATTAAAALALTVLGRLAHHAVGYPLQVERAGLEASVGERFEGALGVGGGGVLDDGQRAAARQHHARDGRLFSEELLELGLVALEGQVLDQQAAACARRWQQRRRVIAPRRRLQPVYVHARRAQRGLGLRHRVHLAERQAHGRVVALDVKQVALGHTKVRGSALRHCVGAHEQRTLGGGNGVLTAPRALAPLLLALCLECAGVGCGLAGAATSLGGALAVAVVIAPQPRGRGSSGTVPVAGQCGHDGDEPPLEDCAVERLSRLGRALGDHV